MEAMFSEARPYLEATTRYITAVWHDLKQWASALPDAEALSVVVWLYPHVDTVRSLFGNRRGNRLMRLARRQFLIPRLRSQQRFR